VAKKGVPGVRPSARLRSRRARLGSPTQPAIRSCVWRLAGVVTVARLLRPSRTWTWSAVPPGPRHGALELLFTVEEERGLRGALALDPSLLRAHFLVNLDTEDPNSLMIGSAGRRTGVCPYQSHVRLSRE
jgi:di/tripeptidase